MNSLLASFIGIVLLAAALGKIRTTTSTVETFLLSLGVTSSMARLGRRTIVPVELIVGCALLSGSVPLAMSLVAAAISIAFFGLQLAALRRANAAPCHCFGSFGKNELKATRVIRTGLLVAAAGSLAMIQLLHGGTRWQWFVAPRGGTFAGIAAAVTMLLGLSLVEAISEFHQLRPRAVRRRRSQFKTNPA